MTSLDTIEGIGPAYRVKLKDIGIGSVEEFLEKGASKSGRKMIADKSGISEKLILEWVNHADLFRIKGVGEEYADLLEEAGVDTVPELAQRNAENLHAKMEETNFAKNLVRSMPSVSQVEEWIVQAKELPRIVTH